MNNTDDTPLMIICSFPNIESARSAAKSCIQKRLAACAKIQSQPVESIYWWKDKIEQGSEFLLILKSNSHLYQECEREIKKQHSFETPEIFGISIDQIEAGYLTWMKQELSHDPTAVR